ncbi:STAS/SEC14 domain-containing protein [Alteromonas sp. CYL-A6]|uniref:STAS/SEC14 domain-containing protein n=1 Tax=Alteromonas nitratireducens TaxID=3390813 RepID=UPI0034B50ABB
MAAPHGKTVVCTEGSIILTSFHGAFNADGIKEYIEKVKAEIARFAGQPFKMLVDDTDIEGGTPDAYEELNRYNEWLNTQPIVAKAFVVKQSVVKDIVLSRTPALKSQQIAFFHEKAEAIDWLNGLEDTHPGD